MSKKKSSKKMSGDTSRSKCGLKLQIVSDLHLEFRPDNLNFLIPTAPVLCLLGDICVIGTTEDFETYKKFIDVVYDQYEIIIHVPGNHEYYNKSQSGKDATFTVDRVNARLRKYAKGKKKLYILNNNMLKLKVDKINYYIIGTTLWTYVDPENYKKINNAMNDYKYIKWSEKGKVRPFMVKDMQKLHKKAVSCIKRFITLAKKVDASVVLLTHHKFLRQKTDVFSTAYESDLAYLIKAPIKLAAYGHVHKNFNGRVNGVKVIANCRGYPSQHTKFNPKLSVYV
jgi:3',5'-cyclic AMP phosphodiesterase CpdA